MKFVALVALLLAAISLFLLAFFPSELDSLARASVEQRGVGIATVLSSAVAPALEFDDAARADELLRGLASTPGALYALVLREDGTPLSSWNASAAPPTKELPTPPEKEPAVLSSEDRIHVVAAITGRTGTQGRMVVGFGLQQLQAQRRSNLLVVGLVSGLLFIVGLGLTFLVGTQVVRPVERLRLVAQHIAQGDLVEAERALGGAKEVEQRATEFGASLQQRDELEQLAGSFALMLTLLRRSSHTLQDAAKRLAESTGALNVAAQEQQVVVGEQARALQATQVTAHELRQTADLASQRAKAVLSVRRTNRGPVAYGAGLER
ncbi:MAG: HAMP domain-containing protein, partial [Myxococcaceae bacterium]|nr:HAMP domain-containing protein [Myxococcaceae bacterium]